jgi:hypothetical protein
MLGRVLERLGFDPNGGKAGPPLDIPGTRGKTRVIRHHDRDGLERLIIREVAWGPVVEAVRAQHLDFDREERYTRLRECLNRRLKNEMISDRFADPVIYLGMNGAEIRACARAVLKDAFEENGGDRTCLITHSMGSVVSFDALADMALHGEIPGGRTIVHYMLANQLAMLDLGKEHSPATLDGEDAACASRIGVARTHLHVVLFCDPNDLLSYHVSEEYKRNHARFGNLCVSYTNVPVTVADSSYFGVLANPIEAHIDYSRCQRVIEALAAGHPPWFEPGDPAVGVP